MSFALCTQASCHRAQTVFRNSENHRDGLQLRNDCERDCSGGLHDVAGIHQPQADAAGDGSGDVAVVDLNLIELHRSWSFFTVPSSCSTSFS